MKAQRGGQRVDRAPADDGGDVLAKLDRDAFLASLRRAEDEADDAEHVRRTLRLWAQRLRPYLDRDPDLTIAQALRRYREDVAPTTRCGAGTDRSHWPAECRRVDD